MKLIFIPLILATASAVAAPPPDKFVPGIYTADSTISHAPPRSTYVLIEPNGDLWAGVNWSRDMHVSATGDVSLRSGYGKTKEVPEKKLDIRVTPSSSAAMIANNFTFLDGNVKASGFHVAPPGKRGAFDVPLALTPNFSTPWVLPSNNYSDRSETFVSNPPFTMTVDGIQIYGSDGGCVYSGRVNNTLYQYKKVTLVYTADCYTDGFSPQVKAGTMYSGVLFPAKHTGMRWDGFMLLLKGEREDKGKTLAKYIITSVQPFPTFP